MAAQALGLVLLGTWAIAAQGQCDCSPCQDYPEDDFSHPCFDDCIVTGDPHVEKSWRPGYEDGFDFQPQGIWRLAKTDTCGGTVEVQAFFCHYFFSRMSSAIAYAISINGGDKYIIKKVGEEFQVGSPNVQTMNYSFDVTKDPVAGKLLVSNDKCVRIKMNTVNLYGGSRTRFLEDPYLNNIFMHVWGCATKKEEGGGICGAPKLSKEWIDPESDENLFKTPEEPGLWKDLCEFCQEKGEAITPPGCPAPQGAPGGGNEPGCEFLRPYGSKRDRECAIQPNPTGDPKIEANNARIRELQGEGRENCVAFALLNNGPKFPGRSCRDWCQDRGAECVAVRDDVGGGRFPSSENTCYLTDADHPKNFVSGTNTPKTCDTVSRDTHCVCKKPDNPAPGEPVERTCAEARDAAGFPFSYLDSADLCRREAMWLQRVIYPQNSAQATHEQRLLLYCVQDVCATDPEDRAEVARSYGDRDPNLNNKPVICNGPLLCNVICSTQLIQDWGDCVNRCEGHRSMLLPVVSRYCKKGLCPTLLEEVEIVGLLQRRSNHSHSTLVASSRRYSGGRRRRRRRRLYKDDDKDGKDDDGYDGSRRRKDDDGSDGSRRRRKDDDGKDDDSDDASRRRRKYDDDGKDDDSDGSRRRRKDDDGKVDDSDDGIKDDDDGGDNGDDDDGADDDDSPPEDECLEKESMCSKLCYSLKLEGDELKWCKHRCTAKFGSQLKPGLDHYCKECKHFCEDPPATTTTTTTTTTEITECPFSTTTKAYFTTTPPDTTTPRDDDDVKDDDVDDGSRRRRKDDGDDGSRRRRKDDDGKDDDVDDGSRRRRKDDDGYDGRRRRKDDDGYDGRRRKDDGYDGRRRKDDGYDGRRRKDDGYDGRRRKDDGYDGRRRKDDGYDGKRRKDDGYDGRRRKDDGYDGRRRKDDGYDGRRRKDDGYDGSRRRRKDGDD